jgi:hypothetical protein
MININNTDYTTSDLFKFAQEWGKNCNDHIDFESSNFKNEIINSIKPHVLGAQVRINFGEDSLRKITCPSEIFSSKSEKEIVFLNEFYNKYDDGWFETHRKLMHDEYLKLVDHFIEHVNSIDLKVGDIVLYQFENNKEKWFEVKIEYIHQRKHSVVAMMLHDKLEQIRVLGYGDNIGTFKRR